MKVSTSIRNFVLVAPLILGLSGMPLQQAVAADQCSSSINNTSNVAIKMGLTGAIMASQVLNGILVTEGQIGQMADRIVYTEGLIGQMANRIVYVTQFSQSNAILAIYAFTNPVYLGQENGHYKYSGTLTKVAALPIGW